VVAYYIPTILSNQDKTGFIDCPRPPQTMMMLLRFTPRLPLQQLPTRLQPQLLLLLKNRESITVFLNWFNFYCANNRLYSGRSQTNNESTFNS
jgi:hypothetical protein